MNETMKKMKEANRVKGKLAKNASLSYCWCVPTMKALLQIKLP